MLNRIIKKIKNFIRIEKNWWLEYRKYSLIDNNHKIIFLANTPEHGNLGDHALAIAEYNLLAEIAPTHEIIELPGSIIRNFSVNRLKKIVKQNPLLLHAGGYLGTLWMIEEQTIRKLLSIFRANTIVIMPQTITYSNDKLGQIEKQRSKEYYDKCRDITIFVRDEKSISEAAYLVGAQNVFWVPDMVIGYLSYDVPEIARDTKCLMCIRQDVEKFIKADTLNTYKQIITQKFPGISILETDTVVRYCIDKKQRNHEVIKKINEFASAQLIITDRLHGMLFAAISSTPCIVLNNSNGKVKGVYNWVKEVPYIKFIDNADAFETALTDVITCKNNKYPNEQMQQKYLSLKDKIRDIITK